MKCVLCSGEVPAHLVGHPRTKYCGRLCRDKAQRIKDRDKRIAYTKAWKERNPERVKELRRLSQQRCKESYAARRSKWMKQNAERMRQSRRKWKLSNPDKRAANVRSRLLIKSRAEPSWLSKEQKVQMVAYYKEAARLTKEKGIPHEVDHIIPIRGKQVCGLHVPWNLQVLTRTENQRKGAR